MLRRAMRHCIAGSDSKWGGDNLHASYAFPLEQCQYHGYGDVSYGQLKIDLSGAYPSR